MTTTSSLLEHLRGLNVEVWAEGEHLRVRAPKGVLTPALTSELSGRKAEILAFLAEWKPADRRPPLMVRARPGEAPLSFNQLRLWLLDQLEPGRAHYNIPEALHLQGCLDLPVLRASVNCVVERHEALRTSFRAESGEPLQVISAFSPLPLPVIDLRTLPADRMIAESRRLTDEEAQRPFDLATPPLLRLTLIHRGAEDYYLLLTIHHIVADGWSMMVLTREIAAAYEAFSTGRPSPLAPLPLQYADFACWQRGWLQGKTLDLQLAYWKRLLAGCPPLLEFPADRPRPPVFSFRGAVETTTLPPDLSASVKAFTRRFGATSFVTLAAAFESLLLRYTDREDIVLGVPIAYRGWREAEGLIGLFANTLVLRSDLSGDPTFEELLARVRRGLIGILDHQDLPFEKLVEELQPERSLSYSPVFQVLFGVEDYPQEDLRKRDLWFHSIGGVHSGSAKFDLAFLVSESNGAFTASLEYSTDLFDRSTILRLVRHFETLLAVAVAEPRIGLLELPLLDGSERSQILHEWNDTARSYQTESCIHNLFEEQVERTPHAPAVVSAGRDLTYAELNGEANRLARHLARLGVGAGTFVAVYLDRSSEMIVAVLAILKAGAAYVPLDPAHPEQRSARILSSLSIRHLLTQGRRLDSVSRLLAQTAVTDVTLLEDEGGGEGPSGVRLWDRHGFRHLSGRNPEHRAGPEDLAYVIFTSGTTGAPKGVAVRHQPAVNLIEWVQRTFGMGSSDRGLFLTSLGFDLSVYDIFGVLAAGGSVRVASEEEVRDPEALLRILLKESITFWDSAPAALQQLAPLLPAEPQAGSNSLRLVFLSGDWIPVTLPDRMRAAFPEAEVVSLGGATEATVWSNSYPIGQIDPGWASIPYGRPISNARYHLLNRALQPCPYRVAGDLYIGGECLSAGYINDPGLTAEKYIPDPFGDRPGARQYRTGDRARYWPDGLLEFLGRLDQQVKIRGFRVELGEIEAVLVSHPEVGEAVVLARKEGGDQRLVGYIVPTPGSAPSASDLRRFLRERLPEYMVPPLLVTIESLPVTANGKVDRKALFALAAPEPSAPAHVHPRNRIEQALTGIWREVLGLDRVGVEDDFFSLGGHSILATQLMFRVRKELDVDLPLRTLFESPTIVGLAAALASRSEEGLEPGFQLPRVEPDPSGRHLPFPLTEIQSAYWIGRSGAVELAVSTHAYFEIDVLGMNLGRLEGAMRRLIDRHDMLRAVVLPDGRQQVLSKVPPYRIRVVDLQEAGKEQAQASLEAIRDHLSHQVLPSDRWPLFDISASRLRDGCLRLHLSFDLLIGDAWSFQILNLELSRLYRDLETELPPLELSFRDYVLAELSLQSSPLYRRALAYWQDRLPSLPLATALPLAVDPSRLTSPRFVRRQGRLEPAAWARLKERSARSALSPSATLLAAYAEVLGTWSASQRFTINLTLFNRLPLHPQVDGIVGDFTSLTLLAVEHSPGETFEERARHLQARLWDDLDHRLVSGVRVLRELRERARAAGEAPPIMPVVFTSTLDQGGEEETGIFAREGEKDGYGITQTPQVWLDHQVSETAGALAWNWDAVEEIFPAGLLDDMFDAYRRLLERLAGEEAAWSDPVQRQLPGWQLRLIAELNATVAPEPADLLHEQFLEQARCQPEALAVITSDRRITYRDLERGSLALAHGLCERGVRPNRLVAVVMEKGWEQVLATLAVLRAGGAYLPVDPHLPAERLHDLLEQGEVEIALTQPRLAERIEWPAGIEPVAVTEEVLEAPEEPPLPSRQGVGDLAYVIFTSGSTGRPKGVMIDHRGALNTVLDINQRFAVGPRDRILALSSLGFDLSVYDLFGILAAGGGIVVPDAGAHRDPAHWMQLMARARVTVWSSVPALMEMLIEQGPEELPPSLRLVLLSGDWIPVSLPDRIRAAVPRAQVISLGGATEASIWSILYPIAQVAPDWASIPYGRPMLNQTFHVLDEELEPCPVWVRGHLYIGGLGLARGYWRDEDKTRAAFLDHPRTGERLYRTGDLGRLLPDGNIEFLGRDDMQVKIRGYRVELGEIEATLLRHPEVRAAAVLAQEHGTRDRRLVAYVVRPGDPASGDQTSSEPQRLVAELRTHAARTLPDWMVPSGWVVIESLPLTSNGKVDRWALARIEPEQQLKRERHHVVPREGLEQGLAAIWAEVLGVETVGAQDDFFELGGHSLLAVRVLSRIRSTMGVEVPLRTLFEAPALAELAACIVALQRGSQVPPLPPLRPVPRGGPLPLSFAQRRLWFIDQLDPGSAVYNIPTALQLRGRLDVVALAGSLNEVVRRHEALRTIFVPIDGRPVQVIREPRQVALPVMDLRGLLAEQASVEARRLLLDEAARPFDLARGPLLRSILVVTDEDEHVVLLNLHHIVGDAWSIDVLLRELSVLYRAFTEGRPSPIAELEIQYADFAAWQNERFSGRAMEQELAYWRQRLEGTSFLELPTDHPRPAVQSSRGAVSSFDLPGLGPGVQALSRQRGATPFMTLLAAFGALLLRFSGQENLVVGSPIANRRHAEVEGLIGFFLNTLALRLDLSGDPTFAGLLERVREMALGAYAHQELPFERMVEEIQAHRSLARTPLFQVMLVLLDGSVAPPPFPDLAVESLGVDSGTAKFDLTLFLREEGTDLQGLWELNLDLFEPVTVLRLTAHLGRLLKAAVADPGQRLSELPLLGEAERAQLLTEWNDTRIPAEEGSLVALFDRQASRTPQAVAAVFGDEELSYEELSSRANRLAHALKRLGVERGTPVGIYLERSLEMAVCVLGVLKVGGVCLPLDPAYPAERLGFMLADAAAPVVLTRGELVGLLPAGFREAAWRVERVLSEPGREQSPAALLTGQDLAYLIYTSGSTGRPKGVAMPHGALRTLMRWQIHRSGGALRTLQFAPLSFDVSFQEMFSTWSAGGTLFLIPEELRRTPADLLDFLTRARIERLFLPFVALRQLAEIAEERKRTLPDLREIVTAGEQLQMSGAVVSWLTRSPGCRLDNQYGPSETHVVTAFRVTGSPESWPALPPIGRPVAGSEVYTLDRHQQPVPTGGPGELYIGGAGVAQGYHGQPAMTAERFLPDPFSGRRGARLYRTGDRVRWGRDGQMEFLGRVDHQVKLRGFRVEPGEIEVVLQEHPKVHQAVVLAQARPAGGELRAWVVPEAGARLTAGELRHFLQGRLPDYMVPARFALLSDLPTTPSGKVDRRSLGQRAAEWDAETAYTSPRGPAEELIAEIFSELLARDRVGAQDDFFQLGGHSLLATQLVSRTHAAFGVDLPLRLVFEKPTVRDLARWVERAMGTGEHRPALPLEAVPRDRPLPASFAQQRLWFLDRLDPDNPAYNLPWAVHLKGRFERGALRAALAEVVRRHEALRTTFAEIDGEPVQVIAPGAPLPFPEVDLSGLPSPQRRPEVEHLVRQEAERPFDLARGPLQRSALLRLREAEAVVLLTMHHIICDGWSIGVLMRELEALYPCFQGGRSSPLSELPIQYADFADWQRRWLTGDVLEEQLAYWRERLRGVPAVLELPLDRPRPPVQTSRGASRRLELAEDLTTRLREASRQADATLFMTLLAVFQVVLQRSTGQDDFTVGTSVGGRNQLQTEDLIGFFVNTLVLQAELSGNPDLWELLHRVREVALSAYAHQDLPFEKLVAELQPERSASYAPLFQVMFVLQNTPETLPRLPGLRFQTLAQQSTTARFDLTLVIEETSRGLLATFEYNRDLFDLPTIARMAQHFSETLRVWGADRSRRALELPFLAEWEQAQVLSEWNDTEGEPLWEGPVHGAFARWAERHPALDALLFEGATLSYGELRERADRLASYLTVRGISPEARVALCMEPSPEMIVGLLGVLAAGAAYVPLDPGQPQERLAFLAADAAAVLLLTQESLRPKLSSLGCELLCLDSQWTEVETAAPTAPRAEVAEGAAAYVIYTSGSTGRPKGVVATHQGLANFSRAMVRTLGLGPGDRVLQFAPLSFDASAVQIFPSLTSGAALVLHPRPRSLSTVELSALCTQAGVTLLDLPAALWRQWVADLSHTAVPIGTPIRMYLTGGESVPSGVLRDWAQAVGPGVRFLSSYGPTEATVTATAFLTESERVERLSSPELPLGSPLENVRVYLLDGQLEPVAIGVPAEVYVSGAGVTRGYLDAPALTAERYLPAPWSRRPGARMYRTGDRARRLPDGTLLFLGRRDLQVKLRGHRIELGEIEAAISRHPGIRERVVLVREERPGDRRLVAFVVPQRPEEISPEALLEHLRRELPAFMIPSLVVSLTELPLTPRGKVDRAALAWMEPAAGRSAQPGAVSLDNAVQELLAGIWAEVLGVSQPGVHDDFFELGGHSLLATQVASRVRAVFGIDLPLRTLFERPTLAELAAAVEQVRRAEEPQAPPLVPVERERDLPLSFAQERLWLLDQLDPGNAAYTIPAVVRLAGVLHLQALAAALGEIVRRHEALRTTFAAVDGRPVQRIGPPAPVPMPVVDLSGLPETAREAEAGWLAVAEARRPFDLAHGPLLRLIVLRTRDLEHVTLLAMHHVVSDGWSVGVLLRELAALYPFYVTGEGSPLPELPVQYADFAVWQRRWLAGGTLAVQLAWWRHELEGAPTTLELPADRPHPAVPSHRGGQAAVELSANLAAGLATLGRRQGATLFMTLLAGWSVLLSRFTGQEDLLVGSPVANRTRLETEGLIGFFVNTLVLRMDLTGEPGFTALLERVRRTTLGAYDHQDLPFERLVEELQPERRLSHSPLIQLLFALQNAPQPALDLPGLSLQPLPLEPETAKVDLTLVLEEAAGGLSAILEYRRDLFDPVTVDHLLRRLETLLAAVVEMPERRVGELPLLTAAELYQVVVGWNDAPSVDPPDLAVHRLFERWVAQIPDEPAVAFGGETWSYAELNRRANRLAHELSAQGVGPETPVAVCLEASAELVAVILAVLKAGGLYVPLDPAYPQERLAFMLEDSGAAVLVAAGPPPAGLEGALRLVRLDRDAERIAHRTETDPMRQDLGGGQLAYVMYTSGSTGRPKGIGIPHRAIVRLVWGTNYVDLRPGDRIAQISNVSFDAATFEIWGALLRGGCLVGLGKDVALSARELGRALREWGIDALFVTTALFNQLVRESADVFRGVRQVLFGGEAVDPRWVREALRNGPPQRLLHVYGPTENTTFSTWQRVVEVTEDALTVPIGRTVASSRVYVLDSRLEPVPVGVPGELYLGGDRLARGYPDRPDLTAERFVPSPPWAVLEEPGARLYQTGDRARLAADGALEFLGRIDRQVKIRGFRIELGEIEAALTTHLEMAEAAVVVQEEGTGGRRLVAYVVPRDGRTPGAGQLRQHLRRSLPEHMIPAAFVVLPALPLTPNGKVDHSALPTPQELQADPGKEAPRTPAEELLAGIWAEVLGVSQPGVHDDFFELGGHSLLATQVASRVRAVFGIDLPLRTLFERPTLAELAAAVEQELQTGRSVAIPPIEPAPRDQPLPLSFAQQRLWFIDQLQPESPLYNIPLALRVRGWLDVPALARSLAEIVRRHEVLRTVFPAVEGTPVQVVQPMTPFVLSQIDLSAFPEAVREREALALLAAESQRPFDLAQGPLLRAVLIALGETEHLAVLNVHHIVSDGWSTGVLVQELNAFYRAFREGRPAPLADLPIQYADFAGWQRRWLSGPTLEAELAYWRERLAGAPSRLELPADHPRPSLRTSRGAIHPLRLPQSLSGGLQALAHRQGSTLFMVLAAALQTLLSRNTGQTDISLGTPIAGRTSIQTEGLIGFFVNTLVLRAEILPGASFVELLEQVRQRLLEAYAHQELPFEKLIEELALERSLSHTPLFQTMLSLQPALRPLELPGLEVEPLPIEGATAKFDLSFSLAQEAEDLDGTVEYSQDLFEAPTVARLAGHFEALLEALAEDPRRRLAELPMLRAGELAQLLQEWNDTRTPVVPALYLHELVEEQARRTPEAVAVELEDSRLSYADLVRRAHRLASRLRDLGVGPDVPVGIAMERSLEMVIGMLGVLAAGGCYLPLDPAYPRDRLSLMLAEARPPVLLVQSRLAAVLPTGGARCIPLDTGWEGADDGAETKSGPFPAESPGPDNLACLFFTSGSTGQPKGVMLDHRGLVNRLLWAQRTYPLRASDRVLQKAAFNFDFSVWECFGPLLAGARVVLARRDGHRDSAYLARTIAEREITVVHFVPSMLRVFLEEEGIERCTSLRMVFSGGEALTPELVGRFFSRLDIPLRNQYGPTEISIDATDRPFRRGDGAAAVPIGRPIANMRFYLLDRQLQPVSIGVAAEICIGGTGLARGYLGRPELTAERFSPDPFGSGLGERLYHTGDLARYRADGEIEILGRIDHQVKIRGFRIEPAEIEATLRRHPAVQDVVVLAREDVAGDRRLMAYLAVAGGADPRPDEWRVFLDERLPGYMVPSQFVVLNALPVLPNGKVDRQALPSPLGLHSGAEELLVAPRTAAEEVLAAIWSEVLGLDRVGVFDDFFRLGGHSLVATRAMARLRNVFGIDVTVRLLFEHPTIDGLLTSIKELAGDEQMVEEMARVFREVEQSTDEEISRILSEP